MLANVLRKTQFRSDLTGKKVKKAHNFSDFGSWKTSSIPACVCVWHMDVQIDVQIERTVLISPVVLGGIPVHTEYRCLLFL